LLRQLGCNNSRYVTLEEQLAIFLYASVTGLSVCHVGERFQRSSDTITKYVIYVIVDMLSNFVAGISNAFSMHLPPPPFIQCMSICLMQTVPHRLKSGRTQNSIPTLSTPLVPLMAPILRATQIVQIVMPLAIARGA